MPSNCCCVPGCHERGGHTFPSDIKQKEKWVVAIRRLDEMTKKLWEPSKSAVVCKQHFVSSDYIEQTIQGKRSA